MTTNAKTAKTIREDCWKCEGSGSVWWGNDSKGAVHFKGGGYKIVNKVCFACCGVGYKMVSQQQIDRRERDRKRRAAQREQEDAERLAKIEAQRAVVDAKRAEFYAAHPDITADALSQLGEFGQSLLESLDAFGGLTENMIAAARRAIAEQAATTAVPETADRIEIAGVVKSIKCVEGWGNRMAVKAVVRDDRGFTLYGSLPSAISSVEPGDRVEFTAAVTRSQDDPTFGFYKRPTKARKR